ncbi:MAG: 3-isopropylmalate dehydratase large subunit, partial [Candidatus Bipolaricaulia bacterium]
MTAGNGMTISEKILTEKAGKKVSAGEIVVAELDLMMFHDGTFHLVTEAWNDFQDSRVENPDDVV